MTAVIPIQNPILIGHRHIGGLWFPADWFDTETRQRLLLQAWQPGSTAWRFATGDLLRWPAAAMLDCDALPGWPLQPAGRALASALLGAAELGGQPSADLWLVVGGELVGLHHTDAQMLDLSAWLSLSHVSFIDTWDLRPAPPEALFVGIEPARDVRQVLGAQLAPASADARAFLEALGKRGAGGAAASARSAPGPASWGDTASSGGPGGWMLFCAIAGAVSLLRLCSSPPVQPPLPPMPVPAVQAPAPLSGEKPPPLVPPSRPWTESPALPGRSTQPWVAPNDLGSVKSDSKDLAARQDAALDFARTVPRPSAPTLSPSLPGNGIAGTDRQPNFAELAQRPEGGVTVPDHPASSATSAARAPGSDVLRRPDDPMRPFLILVVLAACMLAGVILLIAVRRLPPRRKAAKRGAAVPSPTQVGGAPAGVAASGPGSGPATAAPSDVPARLRDRVMPQRWRAWLARLAMTSGVARVLGRQHAAYVRRMLAMFEEGRIDDALKHAIPLGDGSASLGQLLGRMGPRQDLSLSGTRRGSTSVAIDTSLEQHLRQLYRSVFTKLDRAGRVDEAAFVLAELLQARGEALDYLEGHDRCKQAAELALGWDMPAAQIIRLLALSGDWRRALLVARRDNAFAAAVTLLQNKSPDMARRLRREWAESLVAQGRWLAAVDAIWPLTEARAQAQEWLEMAEQAGGTAAARALALRSQCLPETLAARAEVLRRIQCDPGMARERAAMASQLLDLEAPVSHLARSLGAALAGPLLADHGTGEGQLRPAELRRLIDFASDPVLSADMPGGALAERQSPSLLDHGAAVRWHAPEPGLQPLHDAVPLADGEFLVALGEPGLLRLDARGRRIGKVDVPAHRIVVAHDGRSALGLARRGAMWRVSRIDLVRMCAADLGHIAAQAFADQYDGVGWTVANGSRVQVFDTTAPKLDQVLWQVTELPGAVVTIDASPSSETWLLAVGENQFESWCYLLPRRALIHREPVTGIAANTWLLPVASVGVLAMMASDKHASTSQLRPTPERRHLWPSVPTPAPGHPVRAALPWMVMRGTRHAGDGTMTVGPAIEFVLLQTGRVQATMEWPADVPVGIRVFSSCWLLYDLHGRLAVISLQNGWADGLSVM